MSKEKIKVCDLAKQMKTASARIIEKLNEIDIYPKSHMSYLEGEELEKFYNHVGYKGEKDEEKEKKASSDRKAQSKVSQTSSKGVILRRIIIDSDSSSKESFSPQGQDSGGKTPPRRRGQRRVSQAAASDLRQGYQVRDKEDFEYLLEEEEKEAAVSPPVKEKEIKEEAPVKRVKRIPSEPKVKRIAKSQSKEEEKEEKEVKEVKEVKPKKASIKTAKVETIEISEKKPSKKVEKPVEEAVKSPKEPVLEEKVPEAKEAKEEKVEIVKEVPVEKKEIPQPPKEEVKRKEQKRGPQKQEQRDRYRREDRFVDKRPRNQRGRRQKRPVSKDLTSKIKHTPMTEVKLPEVLTVKDFASAIKKTSAEVIKKLMLMGVMANLNQEIDFDTAAIIAEEFGITASMEIAITAEDLLFCDLEDEDSDCLPRPPVVVVMGHVDHGKTSLLDAIRETSVTDREAGGITQHIGAYMAELNGRKITFLDTPGHEAFTSMRARGAQVTDVAILVVAADDGVMPQTVEAINHAKAANVQIVVAVNKIDKEGAEPDRIKQQLTEYGIVSDEWGGDIPCVNVSAKRGDNIDLLLETVLLTADLQDLRANPNAQVKGTIIDAKLDKNRGAVATLLVQRGSLKPSDSIIAGSAFGRIRTMTDDRGNALKLAGPSTPVEITGLPEVPEAGEVFYVVKDEQLARQLTEKRKSQQRERQLRHSSRISLDDLYTQIQAGNIKELNIIIKADVQGSVEALRQSLEKLSNEDVRINVIHEAVGGITESDVTLAEVSNAIIIGFSVRPGVNVSSYAESVSVDIRLYRVIYDAIEDIQTAMIGMLDPEYKEVVQGMAEIRQTFHASGVGTIAGAYVTNGKITRNSEVRVVRDSIVIHEGKLASLKRFKDDVREVNQGYECGFSIERYNDIKVGDIVESFVMEEIKR